jgi:hypothetical protein
VGKDKGSLKARDREMGVFIVMVRETGKRREGE